VSARFDLSYMFENFAYGSGVDDHRDDAPSASAGAPMGIHLKDLGNHARPIGFSLPHGRGGGFLRAIRYWFFPANSHAVL